MTRFIPSFKPQAITKDTSKRFINIDILYLMGIILVVLGHSHPISSDWYGTFVSDMNCFIYTFHMPLFFFIGGFLMVYSKSIEKLGYCKWALGKILKFLIPYFILTIIAFYPKSLLGDTSDVVEFSLGYLFKTTVLIPRQGVWGHFWFIPTFLTLDLIWGFWRSKVNNRYLFFFGLIFGTIASLYLAVFPIINDLFVIYDICQVAIFYALGIIAALCKPTLWDKHWKNWMWIVVSLPIAFILYPYGNYVVKSLPIVNFIVGLLLVWACWNFAQSISAFKFTSFTTQLTQYNFTIFLYSWPAQSLLDVLLRRMGVNWIVIVFAMIVTGFVVPFIIIFVYKRLRIFNCKFFDYLLGIQTTARS